MSVKAMKSGAVEFLTKPFDDNELLDAVQQALARDAARLAEEAEIAAVRARYNTLSPREHEVMLLVVSGLLNKQVAAELGIREITTKIHRGHVMHKMQAGSLTFVRLTTEPTFPYPQCCQWLPLSYKREASHFLKHLLRNLGNILAPA